MRSLLAAIIVAIIVPARLSASTEVASADHPELPPAVSPSLRVDTTAFWEAAFVDKFGFKAGMGLDLLWPVSPRGFAGLAARMSGSYLTVHNCDGDMGLGERNSREKEYGCNEMKRGFFVMALAADFGITLARPVFLKWHVGIEFLMSKEWEIISLLPLPAAGLSLVFQVLDRPSYALLLAPMAEVTFTYFEFEAVASFGLGLTLAFR